MTDELTTVFVLECVCGQRSYIPGYSFNAMDKLSYGTPYKCPGCKKPLGAAEGTKCLNWLLTGCATNDQIIHETKKCLDAGMRVAQHESSGFIICVPSKGAAAMSDPELMTAEQAQILGNWTYNQGLKKLAQDYIEIRQRLADKSEDTKRLDWLLSANDLDLLFIKWPGKVTLNSREDIDVARNSEKAGK